MPPDALTPNGSSAADTSLADHVVAFGRVLRRAGLPIGSDQVVDALHALVTVGVARRADVYQALYSVFVRRREHVELFDQAFHLFWRAPSELGNLMETMLPTTPVPDRPGPRQRVREALEEPGDEPPAPPPEPAEPQEVELRATYSASEQLKQKDFADFTAEEVEQAKELMQRMRWPVEPQRVRRRSPREAGRRLDLRRTIRRGLRHQGELLHLERQGPKQKRRPIVILCDVSGSMESYARMLLHFMHAVTDGMQRVESFVFGTRLTRITRHLQRRDVDAAVDAVSAVVRDWAGGTRIGEAIKTFNYEWLRRTLRSSSVVLVISDGCDRGAPDLLDAEMGRLHRSCHRLLWLNPLLRFDGYEPLTRGMQAALPHVDDFLSVHNLDSLQQLGAVLAEAAHR